MPISPGGTKYEDEELDSLFQAVGFIVVQWGQAEQSLDIITAILYQQLGGKQCAKRVPKMLSTKLNFLRTCVSEIVALAPFKAEADALVVDFQRLSDRRHDLIHGAIASLSPQNGAFMFAKLDIENDFHVLREFPFDSAEFPALTKELIDLGAHTTSLARRLWELVPK